jgi:hypothetical protein
VGPLDRLLMRSQEARAEFDPPAVVILPMLSGHRDNMGRMALTTD